jgi:2,4-dienoyl-CoA reductase-like NADH-dependent reductase (Old Yellow Enzyme family)
MAEATAISPEGRISPADTGIWKDEHVRAWRRIVRFIAAHGAVPGIQLAHAGWKASTAPPWQGRRAISSSEGAWQPVGVGDVPFSPETATPRALTQDEIGQVCTNWREAALRSLDAGFRVIEIHAAHGYLLHSFLSPLSNRRTDEYGGPFENRTRFLLRVASELRAAMPKDVPLLVRLSCTDWVADGWSLDDSVKLSRLLKLAGVDLVDCSSGGAAPNAIIPMGPGYQTAFAATIRQQANIATAAVGMITDPYQAETILKTGQADMVFLARAMLRDPNWPGRAAKALGLDAKDLFPVQYARGW